MRHFPIFLDVAARRVVLAGGSEAALSKLRLLLKTEAKITVFTPEPAPEIVAWAAEGKLRLERRVMAPGDATCAALAYAATDDADEDRRVAALARADGALVNMVDNLEGSQFITPAMVDRDPVVVAIGTEGAAPVLARAIKADLEERLSPRLGLLARIARRFRAAAEALPAGRARRAFWRAVYLEDGPQHAPGAEDDAIAGAVQDLLHSHLAGDADPGRVDFVGAGPGDPDLLTLKARRAIDRADVVIYDRLVAPEILELARREATLVAVGKEGFGPSTPQAEIDRLIVDHAQAGAHVVRLKSGDPGVFGRLEEELRAVRAAGLAHAVVPGITAAAAAAAQVGVSLTERGRNSDVRLITGHDVRGYAEHDWRSLARPGAVAAIYMGKRASRFVQGRLLMHGALGQTPVTVVENASRADSRVIATTLDALPDDIARADLDGPAVLLFGLAPGAEAALSQVPAMEAQV
ncbi:MAG: siroheme synthase CysG [Pseudomonadota bacterium]